MSPAPRDRPSTAQRGYNERWRRTRARFLRKHPRCEDCGAPATDVDHRDGLGPNGPHGHDESNLRAYCHTCHSKRTARDQPGGWNARPPRRRKAEPHPGLVTPPEGVAGGRSRSAS